MVLICPLHLIPTVGFKLKASKYHAFVERINNVSNALKYSAGTGVNIYISVTCYSTQVNTPRLNPSHAGRYSI